MRTILMTAALAALCFDLRVGRRRRRRKGNL